MKHRFRPLLILLFAFMLCGFAVHKFYVGVFTIEHAPQKKALQLTARIFVDDLEVAFKRKYGRSFYLGTSAETADAKEYLQRYLAEKISLKVNGVDASLKFLGKEAEDDVLICYCSFAAPQPVKAIQIKNTLLMDAFPDQQNIIHFSINSNKKSLLLTNDDAVGTLSY